MDTEKIMMEWVFPAFLVLIMLFLLVFMPYTAYVKSSYNARVWQSQGHDITAFEAFCGVRPYGDDERHTVGVEQR